MHPSPPPPAGAHPARIGPRLSIAIWTVPALLSTLETVYFSRLAGRPMEPWRAFAAEAPQWYGWALLTPAIVLLGQRFPLRRPVRARSVWVHLAAILVSGALIAAATSAVNLWARPSPRGFTESAVGWFLSGLPATVVAYLAILGVSYALGSAAELRERERRAAELEAQLRDAQLAALRMQLQPHFLFNSLNAIMALVRSQDTGAAVRAITLLSDVLRIAVDAGEGHETTLAEELEFVSRYLEMERVRFGDRLSVRLDVADALLTARVPRFVLQPFVENSLKHGVLKGRAGNTISIAAARDDALLWLTVRDDGIGLTTGDGAPAGVGIRNARARLQRMYGDAARLTVTGNPGGSGVVVEILLPLRA